MNKLENLVLNASMIGIMSSVMAFAICILIKKEDYLIILLIITVALMLIFVHLFGKMIRESNKGGKKEIE
jgi:hypothetical protein